MKNLLMFFAIMATQVEQFIRSFKGYALPIVFSGSADESVQKTVTLYVAGDAADLSDNNGQTLVNLIKKENSVNNIGQNRLPKNTSFLIEEIAVLYQDAGAGITLKTATWADAPPPAFLNGEFKITVKGTGVCFDAPGHDLGNSQYAATGNDDIFRPISPILIKSEKEFDFVFSTVGDYAGFYKILVRGKMYSKPTDN